MDGTWWKKTSTYQHYCKITSGCQYWGYKNRLKPRARIPGFVWGKTTANLQMLLKKTLKHLPISLETIYWEWKSYWKWPLTVDLPIKMVIFHCKRLPEGTSNHIPQNPRFVCVPLPTCWPLPPTIASIARGTESCHSQGFCRVTSKQAVGEDSIQRGAVSKAACGWCLDMFPRHLIGA